MAIKKDTLDGLLAGRDPQAVFAKDGLFDELKKALAERVLNAEMDDHLDGEVAEGRANSRNGYGRNTLLTETGNLPIAVPRDRLATFEPQQPDRQVPAAPAGLRRQGGASMYAREVGARSRAIFWSFMALRSLPISFRR